MSLVPSAAPITHAGELAVDIGHQSEQQGNAESKFAKIIENLAKTSHGSESLRELRTFLSTDVKKTRNRETFLAKRILRPPIKWLDVKDQVWESEEERLSNQYAFLQGDVVESRLVKGLEGGPVDHDRWMVLSADCDSARTRYVRVAPVYPVLLKDPTDSQATLNYTAAMKLQNSRMFAIPPLPSDDPSQVRGYWIDLVTPHYFDFGANDLARELVTQLASLTIPYWHVLNALLIDIQTRANLDEGLRLRS